MKTAIVQPSFADFLAAWLAAGKPTYLNTDSNDSSRLTYLNAPVYCCNHVRISKEGLPADILARFPQVESVSSHTQAICGPSWTREHGNVLDVSYSAYSNGWSLFGVATYLPNESRWVHPSEVHTYRSE